VASEIEAAGGVKNSLAIWTRWGWIPAVDVEKKNFGYNIRRQKLDPILRRAIVEAPGVTYLAGWKAASLRWNGKRVCGVDIETTHGDKQTLLAPLTVAADGRQSTLVELAGVDTEERPNHRFSCFAIFRNIPGEDRSRSRMWLLDPEIGYQFPNDDGTTLIAIMPNKTELARFKEDPELHYRDFIAKLDEAPDVGGAELITKVMINSQNSNLLRRRPPDGMALIGDAAMTSDPLAGVGISWGVMSAEWLVDCVREPLRQRRPLGRALLRYRIKHLWELRAHHKTITDMSLATRLNPVQRLLFSSAVRDATQAELVNDFMARDIGVGRFLSPQSLARAAWVNVRHAVRGND
jgi:2-polyprenyl-6-methoxyphenol hydroxylase-like FAD-dependent oxidoreductase